MSRNAPSVAVTHLALLVALTLLVYVPFLGNAFLTFDDSYLIVQNKAVLHISFASLRHIFTSFDPELYNPLTILTYQALHTVFGLHPAGFHAWSVLLHVANSVLVYVIVFHLFHRRRTASIASLLFALHPIQVEAVLWAAALKDVQSTFFFLVTVWLYLLWRAVGERRWYALSIGSFLLAILSKVSVAPLPFVLLLIDALQQRPMDRRTFFEKWPYVALSMVFVAVAFFGKAHAVSSITPLATLLLFFKASIFALWKMFVPTGLTILYEQLSPISFGAPQFFWSTCMVLLLCACACWCWKRKRSVSIAILFYFLMLAPIAATFSKNGFIFFFSDRYSYIALLAVAIPTAAFLDVLYEKYQNYAVVFHGAAAVALMVLMSMTYVQAGYWKNSEAVFRRVVSVYPQSAMAHNNIGAEISETQEGLDAFIKATTLNPLYMTAWRNVAAWYFRHGKIDLMKQTYERAMQLLDTKPSPSHEDLSVIFEYAEYLDSHSEPDRAMQLLLHAVDLSPDFTEAYFNVAIKKEKAGLKDEAIQYYQRAVEMDNPSPDAFYRLANLRAERGELQVAVTLLTTLLSIDPEYPNAERHLTSIKQMLGQ